MDSNNFAVSVNSSVFLNTIMFIVNQSSFQESSSYYNYYAEIGKGINLTKCYGVYGCFDLQHPWTSEHRPVSLFPEDLEKVDPKYILYTRKNRHIPIYFDLNDEDPILASGMDPIKPVYSIAHGYMEGGGIDWIKEMTQNLLDVEDCSVIVVDWHGGSGPPYTQAVANIRLVGAVTAHLLAEVARYAGNLDKLHCIGHSLGAHLSGYIGYTLQKDFNLIPGRITGLDPAEPHFAKAQRPVRLDKSAAKYVDIVHTDASQFIRGGLGITENIGHVDYFPNGGTDQPGCKKPFVQYMTEENGSLFHGVRKYLSCNHMRSYEFFIESIIPKCSFLTFGCPSYEDFLEGKCASCGSKGEKCLKFGYHGKKDYDKLLRKNAISKNTGLVQYFITGEKRPYCRAHYKISVTVSNSEESRDHKGEIGQLVFTMHTTMDGKGYKTSPVPFTEGYYEPGGSYVGVVAAGGIKRLKALEVDWQYHSSVLNPLTWRILTAPRIYIDQIIVEVLGTNERLIVCSKKKSPIISGLSQILIPGYC